MPSNFYRQKYEAYADQAAMDAGIPASVLKSVITNESSWNPFAVGSQTKYGWQAMGIAQFSPDTAKQYNVDVFNAESSITGAATYLKDLFAKYGNWNEALAVYGSGSPTNKGGLDYAAKVLTGLEGELDMANTPEGSETTESNLPAWLQGVVDWVKGGALNVVLVLCALLLMVLGGYKLFNQSTSTVAKVKGMLQ